jgi:DNA-binding NarL/FixJ family response regulator
MIPICYLSSRETHVLQWLIKGIRGKDIAPLLGLTTRSVTRIVWGICEKLGAHTRTQVACMYLTVKSRQGVVGNTVNNGAGKTPQRLRPNH